MSVKQMQREPEITTCEWALDEPDSDTWATDCGHWFTLNDGTPTHNRMAFCCYCGGRLQHTQEDAP